MRLELMMGFNHKGIAIGLWAVRNTHEDLYAVTTKGATFKSEKPGIQNPDNAMIAVMDVVDVINRRIGGE